MFSERQLKVGVNEKHQAKDNLVLAFINRNGKIIIPSGSDTIEIGDTFMVNGTEYIMTSDNIRPKGSLYEGYGAGFSREELDEQELAELRNREIGFIFQNSQLLPRLTARKNVELPLVFAGVRPRERRERAEAMLERVGLADRMDHLPNQLSGGQQQRVAIARAMICNPSILLADEPTGALDQKTGAQIMQLFRELNEEKHTIIMITHDLKIASNARRVVHIIDGEITEGGLQDA